MVRKRLVAMALLLVGCAPEVSAVRTTSAEVPSANVDTLQVTNAGAAPATPASHEQAVETKARPSGGAYLLLGAVVLMPFILLPNAKGVVGLYVPNPAFAPAAGLPSGELPGTAEIVSTLGPAPIVAVPQVITPQASTTILGVPVDQAWRP